MTLQTFWRNATMTRVHVEPTPIGWLVVQRSTFGAFVSSVRTHGLRVALYNLWFLLFAPGNSAE